MEIYLGTTVPISLVHGLKLIHVPWRYPTHTAYQMEAECQVLKLSPKLIVSLSNSTHTLYHKLMEKTSASLQRPEFSSLHTYQSTIQPGKHELTGIKKASQTKKEMKVLTGRCLNSSVLTRWIFSGIIIYTGISGWNKSPLVLGVLK